jgi:hypothetical protein
VRHGILSCLKRSSECDVVVHSADRMLRQRFQL